MAVQCIVYSVQCIVYTSGTMVYQRTHLHDVLYALYHLYNGIISQHFSSKAPRKCRNILLDVFSAKLAWSRKDIIFNFIFSLQTRQCSHVGRRPFKCNVTHLRFTTLLLNQKYRYVKQKKGLLIHLNELYQQFLLNLNKGV